MMLNAETYPQRKKLPHEIPSWVTQGARHYITINCRERGTKNLCQAPVAIALLKGGESYEELGRWCLWVMLIMPDHLHLIATFNLSQRIQSTVTAWKGYQAKTFGVQWQTGFFEHRLRNNDEYTKKARYIRTNPVRKGLVVSVEDWPFVIERSNSDYGTARQRRLALPGIKK